MYANIGLRLVNRDEEPKGRSDSAVEEVMSRLRILILGPGCDPECVSIPFVSYCHAAALAQIHDVTLVAGAPVEEGLRRAKAPFRAIEVVRMPVLDRLYAWSLRRIFKYNYD